MIDVYCFENTKSGGNLLCNGYLIRNGKDSRFSCKYDGKPGAQAGERPWSDLCCRETPLAAVQRLDTGTLGKLEKQNLIRSYHRRTAGVPAWGGRAGADRRGQRKLVV